jgi:hypothetical protein
LESTDTRASGIGGYYPHLLKYQGVGSMNYILKEMYCSVFEASLGVLKFE